MSDTPMFLPPSQRKDVRPESAAWTHANELRLHQAFVQGLNDPLVFLESICTEMFRSPAAITSRLEHLGQIRQNFGSGKYGYEVVIGRQKWLTFKEINTLARKYK